MHNFELIIKVSVYTKLYNYSIALDRNLVNKGLYSQVESKRPRGISWRASYSHLSLQLPSIINWGQGSYCYRNLAATSTQSQHKPASPHNSHLSQGDGES